MISEDEVPQKEKTTLSSQTLLLSSLPDEIIENILAHSPKWTYPNLFLVCKKFLALLSSPQLYTTRSNLGTTEPCLYICMMALRKSPQWFALSMKPQETLTGNREILNDFSLIPVPSYPHSTPRIVLDSTIAVGSDIYVIGGGYDELTSSVRILDCQNHTWRDAPNMTVARAYPIAVYLDEKIYVMDGCENDQSPNWIEVFDIKTQTWRALPSPGADDIELCDCFVVKANALEGKIYVASYTKDYTYDPKCGTWKVVREKSSFQEIRNSCVIDNVMYSFCKSRYIKWYDSEDKEWREIKGLEGLCLDMGLIMIIRIVNYGGKLVLIWRQNPDEHSENPKSQIRCARIALEKRHKDEIWGKTEWLNTVLEIPKSYYIYSTCVAVSI